MHRSAPSRQRPRMTAVLRGVKYIMDRQRVLPVSRPYAPAVRRGPDGVRSTRTPARARCADQAGAVTGSFERSTANAPRGASLIRCVMTLRAIATSRCHGTLQHVCERLQDLPDEQLE